MAKHSSALLEGITYLPAIRSRQAELRGYRELRAETKATLRPIVSLGKLGRVDDPARVLEAINAAAAGTYFLDLNTMPGQQCAGWEGLCDPADNYARWRMFAALSENAIPVALLQDGALERAFVKQVQALEASYGIVIARSRRPGRDLGALQAALSAVDDVNNLLIVLDFGYIRGAMDVRETEARQVITALRTIDGAARIAILASSYPRAVTAFGELRGSLEIVERAFHYRLGGDDVAIYGDHASIYPEYFEPSVSRWVPRIDYCTDNAWIYRRHRDAEVDGKMTSGYVICARQITALPEWEPEFATTAWGAGIIQQTATSGSAPQGFGSPSNWIAARLNMHIERQNALATRIGDFDMWSEDDGED
ncbi:MAG: hypothetical protein JNJ63_11830 [Hyphomonadaceae bacterium]|nr:hypothetical protein [Hyphomonadaceae bacterium]